MEKEKKMNGIVLQEINTSLRKTLLYKNKKDKIEIIVPSLKIKSYNKIWDVVSHILRKVLLPTGWPHSVSDDYIQYQIWDSLQAFCSSISGILATRAILIGVGVGDSNSKPLSATITWILKDGTGMLGGIIFASIKGKSLDTHCKKWRLFADILNDCAMTLELIIPTFMSFSTELLCVSTCMKAVVGVAGGATRAAITQHQAVQGNTGDVSAKDGSQETFVNLCASLIGILLLSINEERGLDWLLFITFSIFHVYFNYKAVRSLNMKSLNEDRYVLLVENYLTTGNVANPIEINNKETVFIGFGVSAHNLCNFNIKIGCSLNDVWAYIPSKNWYNNVIIYEDCHYILLLNKSNNMISVLLQAEETPDIVLKAYFNALYYGLSLCLVNNISLEHLLPDHKYVPLCRLRQLNFKNVANLNRKIQDLTFEDKKRLQDLVNQEFLRFKGKAITAGWNFNIYHLKIDEWRYQK